MKENELEARRSLMTSKIRKLLDKRTWPQVMAVFGYANPRAPRTSEVEFGRLRERYEQIGCYNMVKFIEFLQFHEEEFGVAVSYNFSMRSRLVPGDIQEPTTEDEVLLLNCPDLLIGTWNGIEGATVWLSNFYEAMPYLVPESFQLMDNVFREAVEKFEASESIDVFKQ